MTDISLEQLSTIVGGAGDSMGPIRDRNGNIVGGPGEYNKYTERSRKNPYERFEDDMKDTNRFWKVLNSFGRGTRVKPVPQVPPYKPRY